MQQDLNIANKLSAGIYIHIPYCKRKCTYCNFHFSTNLKTLEEMNKAICDEIEIRKVEAKSYSIQSIYLGGGTPSLLSGSALEKIMATIYDHYHVKSDCEITLEANPDDIDPLKLNTWLQLGINRLSIGIQSFHEEDLGWMNRSHTAEQAKACLIEVKSAGYQNFTIDLMYGLPASSKEKLQFNLDQLLTFQVPHFSAYALTPEERTALIHLYKTGNLKPPEDIHTVKQMYQILDFCEGTAYEAYEISNFAKPGFRSRHNSSYWKGLPYLGFGPSAHSYDGVIRRWNIANNNLYIQNISIEQAYSEREVLSDVDHFNEYILLNLRRVEGLNLKHIQLTFAPFYAQFLKDIQVQLDRKDILFDGTSYILSRQGRTQADRISAEMFAVKQKC
ncbi:MAG: radical SAM family heme chaperone HemW [Saprospiraceae bacterium]|nr:radical SAM family heme chaperone HemW [Saprospiraceae bacterium]